MDINYGGSTGYGREYRERLKGNWGIVDVQDSANAVRYLSKEARWIRIELPLLEVVQK
ncbi:prolyl oligopeptidase family serine peptidase [Bacillus carboniphilus]|uniref:prolyl oligopeptidase family serine peptidase n=1 Tax=Bacillus carboniphilus TaxID=86663 RepID=UPI003CD08823